MRVGIDARFLTHPQVGGFKTYATSLIEAIRDVDRENHYLLYVDRPMDPGWASTFGTNVSIVAVPERLPVIGMPWREQVSLFRRAWTDRLDLFHAPALTAPLRLPCPLVVTLHDMLWRGHEASFGRDAMPWRRRAMQAYYRLVPEWAARRADAIITVSEASKAAIVEELGVQNSRVFVTLEAASRALAPVRDPKRLALLAQRLGVGGEYVLALGSADPRKNLHTLLKAYRSLSPDVTARYTLVLVMAHARLADTLGVQISTLGLERHVKLLSSVGDEDLEVLYSGAAAFVFPSLMEGFGLPVLEAMTCGTAVVAADNSSIPEVAGDAAMLFDARDDRALCNALTAVLTDSALRQSLVERGAVRARQFSWETCARQTLACYRWVFDQSRAAAVR